MIRWTIIVATDKKMGFMGSRFNKAFIYRYGTEYYVNKVFTGTIQTILMSFDWDFVNEVYGKWKYIRLLSMKWWQIKDKTYVYV